MLTPIRYAEFYDYPQEMLEFATVSGCFESFQTKGLIFTEDHDDLDWCMWSAFRLPSGKRLALTARHRHPDLCNRVVVIAHADDENPVESLDEFLRAIGAGREIVEWMLPSLTQEPRWVLMLEDFRGKQFVAANLWEQSQAESALAHYAAKRPNYKYWLDKRSPFPDVAGS